MDGAEEHGLVEDSSAALTEVDRRLAALIDAIDEVNMGDPEGQDLSWPPGSAGTRDWRQMMVLMGGDFFAYALWFD